MARPVPSLNDVANTKAEMLFRELGAIIADQDLTPYIDMIEAHVNEEDYTAMDIAARLFEDVHARRNRCGEYSGR